MTDTVMAPRSGRAAGPAAGTGPGEPRPGRRGARALVTAAVAGLLVLALGYLAVAGWRSTGADLDQVRAERQGAGYAGPMTALLAGLSEAEAAATAGQPVDEQAVRSAADAVAAVDARTGDALGVRAAWTDLRRRIGTGAPATGPAARDLVDRAVVLLGTIHQQSSLAADPDPATRGLAAAVLSDLPELVAGSGRYAAALALPAADLATAGLRAAAADRVGRAAATLDRSLRAGLDPGTDRSVALGVVEEVRLAAADAAPAGPGAAPTRTAADQRAAASRLDDAARRLADTVGTGIGERLRSRAADLSRQRWTRTGVAALVLALTLGTLWVRMPAARAYGPVEELGPVVRGPADDPGAEPPSARLIDARALLREVEVVRVGRAVRSGPRHHREAEDPPAEDDRA